MYRPGYTSWNSDPFQRPPPMQHPPYRQYSSFSSPYPYQHNTYPFDPYGPSAGYGPPQIPQAFTNAPPWLPPPGPSQAQPLYQSERYNRHRSAIDPTPDTHLNDLRQAMDASVTPPSSPPPPNHTRSVSSSRDLYQTTSTASKIGSFLKGLAPLKATLCRKFPEARYAVIDKLNELGIEWEEPHGQGSMYCQSGVRGTSDYISFSVRWTVNGAQNGAPAMPGGYQWFTKIEISKDKGNGSHFRELGKEVLGAAKYEIRGPARLDYSISNFDMG